MRKNNVAGDAARYRALYKKLYRLFDDATPLQADCGTVCGKACCGGDDTVGMLLFPGEETALRMVEAEARRYVLCGGRCRREERPLSCRIFPFFPAADERGRITVVADARGAGICPLVRQCDSVRFSRRFLRRVKKAGRLLCRDAACRAFLMETGGEIAAVAALREALNGEAVEKTRFSSPDTT